MMIEEKSILNFNDASADDPSAHSAFAIIAGISVSIPSPIPLVGMAISTDSPEPRVSIVPESSVGVKKKKPPSIVIPQFTSVALAPPMFLIITMNPSVIPIASSGPVRGSKTKS